MTLAPLPPRPSQKVALNHVNYRIRDPVQSLRFYRDILGMTVLNESASEKGKFTNYFLGFNVPEEIANGTNEQKALYR
ncbi:hypothetical protein BC830DRAFT_1166070 [Chytriomyces sp. MP71]|nr:hypothetical protein BC830DRAFT_1166070 [Chytriomyces sp. MP71]